MQFSKKKEPVLDMAKLARQIDEEYPQPEGPRTYAPPAVREPEEPIYEKVKKFGELPMREIDDIVISAKDEFEELEREAQALRDLYVRHITKIRERLIRLQDGMKLSMDMFKKLREQCAQMDEPNVPKSD